MARLTQTQIERLIDDYKSEKSYRSTAESHWQEIADLFHPEAGWFLGEKSEGQKVMDKIYDSFPLIANQLLASAEFSMLTSPSNQWFKFVSPFPEFNQMRHVLLWYTNAARTMFQDMNKPVAGFMAAMHEGYLEFNPFGNITVFADETEDRKALKFYSLPLSETYYITNYSGDVVGFFRVYNRTVIQLKERFGLENLHTEVQKLYHQDQYNTKIQGMHVVMPRLIYNMNIPSSVELPYASLWIDLDNKFCMKESGYHEQPFAAAPFFKSSQEKYGRGPGSIALPDAKMLMRVAQVTIRAAQKAIDPPLQVPDRGFYGPTRTYAGGINYYQRGTKDKIEPLQSGAQPKLGIDYMQEIKQGIKQAFYIDQLQLHEGPQMTATEVIQRTEERLRLMGPWLGRLMTFLYTLGNRVYGIERRAGRIPPPPKEIRGMPMKMVLTSPIARAQEQLEANGIARANELILPMADRKPEIMDLINEDEEVRGIYEIFNVTPRFLNDPNTVKQLRAQRAQQAKEKADAENIRDAGQGMQGMTGALRMVQGGQAGNAA